MFRKLLIGALAFGTAGALATPAAAVPTSCEGYAVEVLSGWTKCAGFYDNNVFGGDAAKIALQKEAVTFLGGSYDGNFGALYGFPSISSTEGARTFDLGRTFTGKVIIGAHFGNIGMPRDAFGNVSAFYLMDFGAGKSSIHFVQSRGLSNLYVFKGPTDVGVVPEPSTWLLLIAGFGALGAAMRRRRSLRPLTA
jgi:hypothetical protein